MCVPVYGATGGGKPHTLHALYLRTISTIIIKYLDLFIYVVKYNANAFDAFILCHNVMLLTLLQSVFA